MIPPANAESAAGRFAVTVLRRIVMWSAPRIATPAPEIGGIPAGKGIAHAVVVVQFGARHLPMGGAGAEEQGSEAVVVQVGVDDDASGGVVDEDAEAVVRRRRRVRSLWPGPARAHGDLEAGEAVVVGGVMRGSDLRWRGCW